jgi:lysine-N-methylase
MEDRGGCVLLLEKDCSGQRLYDEVVSLLADEERCKAMRKALIDSSMPDSADRICDIITELGEDSLCHICHDHPRFRNVLGDRVELGLGLCCEAASRLILSQTEPFSLVELPPEQAARERHAHEDLEELDGLSAILIDYRDATIPILTNRTAPLSDRIRHVFANLYVDLSESVTLIIQYA